MPHPIIGPQQNDPNHRHPRRRKRLSKDAMPLIELQEDQADATWDLSIWTELMGFEMILLIQCCSDINDTLKRIADALESGPPGP